MTIKLARHKEVNLLGRLLESLLLGHRMIIHILVEVLNLECFFPSVCTKQNSIRGHVHVFKNMIPEISGLSHCQQLDVLSIF